MVHPARAGPGRRRVGRTLTAIGRALRLTADEVGYLFRLAGLGSPPTATGPAELDPDTAAVFDRFGDLPAHLTDRVMDVLGWNAAAAALFGEPAGDPGNLLRFVFADPGVRERVVGWESLARGFVERFRAESRNAEDPRAASLVAELRTASPEFARWWAEHRVGGCPGTPVVVAHPTAGRKTFRMRTLYADWAGEVWLTAYLPATAAGGASSDSEAVRPPGR